MLPSWVFPELFKDNLTKAPDPLQSFILLTVVISAILLLLVLVVEPKRGKTGERRPVLVDQPGQSLSVLEQQDYETAATPVV